VVAVVAVAAAVPAAAVVAVAVAAVGPAVAAAAESAGGALVPAAVLRGAPAASAKGSERSVELTETVHYGRVRRSRPGQSLFAMQNPLHAAIGLHVTAE
jgi:hypothetical protein